MDNDSNAEDIKIFINKPTASASLIARCEQVNKAYGNLRAEVIGIYNQALSEGFTPEQAKKFIFENTDFRKRTIYRYLPVEAKNPNMGRLTLPTGKVSKLSTQVSELASFVSENTPRLVLDQMKQYAEELRTGQAGKPQPNEFSKELKRCANKVKLVADAIKTIQEKATIYKVLDSERDEIMAREFNETVTDGIFRIIEDFFKVIFGEWWTGFEKKYEKQS